MSLAASCCVGIGLGFWGLIVKPGGLRAGGASSLDEADDSPDLIVTGHTPLAPVPPAEESGSTGERSEDRAKAAGVSAEIGREWESEGVLGVTA